MPLSLSARDVSCCGGQCFHFIDSHTESHVGNPADRLRDGCPPVTLRHGIALHLLRAACEHSLEHLYRSLTVLYKFSSEAKKTFLFLLLLNPLIAKGAQCCSFSHNFSSIAIPLFVFQLLSTLQDQQWRPQRIGKSKVKLSLHQQQPRFLLPGSSLMIY